MLGFKGSGKDTVGKHLVKAHGFKSTAFADPLKKSLAALMDWQVKDLAGVTTASRTWRETPDPYWSAQLGRPITPRYLMQQYGTEIIRANLHNDFWVMRTQKMIESSDSDWVVTDVRFPNEIKMIREMGGVLIRVKRGEDPAWCDRAVWINRQPSWLQKVAVWLDPEIKQIHASERAWLGHPVDVTLENDHTVAHLHEEVNRIIAQLRTNT